MRCVTALLGGLSLLNNLTPYSAPTCIFTLFISLSDSLLVSYFDRGGKTLHKPTPNSGY